MHDDDDEVSSRWRTIGSSRIQLLVERQTQTLRQRARSWLSRWRCEPLASKVHDASVRSEGHRVRPTTDTIASFEHHDAKLGRALLQRVGGRETRETRSDHDHVGCVVGTVWHGERLRPQSVVSWPCVRRCVRERGSKRESERAISIDRRRARRQHANFRLSKP